ncbi:MAG TPA: hypothetical protein VF257_01380, partial [Solirubrobacteraceae bacterium]
LGEKAGTRGTDLIYLCDPTGHGDRLPLDQPVMVTGSTGHGDRAIPSLYPSLYEGSAPPEPSPGAGAPMSTSDDVPEPPAVDLPGDAREEETSAYVLADDLAADDDSGGRARRRRGRKECTCCSEVKLCRWSPDGLGSGWWCDRCIAEVEEELQARAVAVERVAADPADEVDEDHEAGRAEPEGAMDAAEVPAGAAADVRGGDVMRGDGGGGSLGHGGDYKPGFGPDEDDGIPF